MYFSGDTNVSYVCSRPYRAPELVLGKEEYSVEVDWWSAGCVIAEIVLHRPLFCSSRGPSHQIKAMSRVLGPPTDTDIECMKVKKKMAEEAQCDRAVERQSTLEETLPEGTDPGLIELALTLLKYSPEKRATPIQALGASFFEPLQDKEANIRLPNGKNVALSLVQLTEEEEAKLKKHADSI
jgi:serine/threonine protein kinase